MAQEARKGAMKAGQYAAAVAATKEIGVLTGIMDTRMTLWMRSCPTPRGAMKRVRSVHSALVPTQSPTWP
jgi:hypothetical protein